MKWDASPLSARRLRQEQDVIRGSVILLTNGNPDATIMSAVTIRVTEARPGPPAGRREPGLRASWDGQST